MAAELGLAVTAWSPLGGGVLSGKYRKDSERPQDTRFSGPGWGDTFLTERNYAIAECTQTVAQELGRSPSQVALAWLRQRKENAVIPILGARRLAQIQDNLACLDLQLSEEHLARLDRVSAISLGFPHDFLATPMVHQLVHGSAIVEPR